MRTIFVFLGCVVWTCVMFYGWTLLKGARTHQMERFILCGKCGQIRGVTDKPCCDGADVLNHVFQVAS